MVESPPKLIAIREMLETRERAMLAATARLSQDATRRREEPESPVRTAFQRDRDRITHSKSFRRLMHKTQVFIAPLGDHYRTRLMHTLEVTQIARTIGRALRLNEDLIEAIGLGHDLGHTPFGHAGERAIAEILLGFRHNEQSLRVVDVLERDGRGLNLTNDVRDGILNHSKARSGIADAQAAAPATCEGAVVKIADAIAYINHDLDDALRAGLLDWTEIPDSMLLALGQSHAERINTLVCDIIVTSQVDRDPGLITMSPPIERAANALRDLLFERLYTPLNQREDAYRAQHVVRSLVEYYLHHSDQLPAEFCPPDRPDPPVRQAADYVASMTDRFAIELYEQLFVPRYWPA